mmetsp:Transcript_63180/g.168740  ORF Transcript_63180/g.168740 Transcript_63180/m.168740 type:complete len:230 (-) Transcript_63180:136-825(-)
MPAMLALLVSIGFPLSSPFLGVASPSPVSAFLTATFLPLSPAFLFLPTLELLLSLLSLLLSLAFRLPLGATSCPLAGAFALEALPSPEDSSADALDSRFFLSFFFCAAFAAAFAASTLATLFASSAARAATTAFSAATFDCSSSRSTQRQPLSSWFFGAVFPPSNCSSAPVSPITRMRWPLARPYLAFRISTTPPMPRSSPIMPSAPSFSTEGGGAKRDSRLVTSSGGA